VSLLLDENLSHQMLPSIRDIFPDATHVREHGLISASDDEIWNFARDRELVIVTRDFDFIERSLVEQGPPKILRLAIGNTDTQAVLDRIIGDQRQILDFIDDPDQFYLELA